MVNANIVVIVSRSARGLVDDRDSLRFRLGETVRRRRRRVGATEAPGAVMLSYLLFEQGFTNALMDLGKQDAHAMMHSILAFIDHHS
ncbi:MAG: hypothetical protein EBW74_12715 [Betaproteobacteria bacterium]|nr:hypothetical protein [Betaproteobacteria bacterium]